MHEIDEQIKCLTALLETLRSENLKLKHAVKTSDRKINRLKGRLNEAHGYGNDQVEILNGNPVDIFPEEVWDVILSYIQDSDELLICFNVCKLWRNVLLPRRTSFLFHEVLPLIDSMLDMSDILSCRLVSRWWRRSIDNYLQNHPAHVTNPSFFSHSARNSASAAQYTILLKSSQAVENFLGRNHSENPFFNRSITFRIEPPTLDYQTLNWYWTSVNGLLEQYGNQIWYCHINPGGFPPSLMYSKLRDSLVLMPNLKVLSIFLGGPQFFRETRPFIDFVEQNPLPELYDLVKLKVSNVPHVMLNMLLRKYDFVRKLEMYVPRGDEFDYKEETNLKGLEEFSTTDDNLSNFTSVHWPVEKLSISFIRRDFEMDAVFQTVNMFANTLRVLSLNLEYLLSSPLDGINRKFLLPHLEKLHLVSSFGRHFDSVDFLLPLTSLRELILDYRSCVNDVNSGEHIIQVCEYWDNMYNSNIWKLFPSLERVDIKYVFLSVENMGRPQNKEYHYTRTKYNAYLQTAIE